MNAEEQQLYDNFVARLNGQEAGGKPPFAEFSNAMKALPHLKVPKKVKEELADLAKKKFGRDGSNTHNNKPKPATAADVKESVAAALESKASAPVVVRTPVYDTIPAHLAARLEFLRDAIDGNVAIIHGLKEAKEADPTADVSEVQGAVNHLNWLTTQHEQEVKYILQTVFPKPGASPNTAAQTPMTMAPSIPSAPVPPTPPAQGLNAPSGFKRPIGFAPPSRDEQTEPDPREVAMLEKTKPKYRDGNGIKIR